MIGSTDSHTSLATAQEDNFFGKHSGAEPSPERMSHPFMENENGTIMGWQQVASGLAAVWATENTREAIFDAMERKEIYATTGSRDGRALLRRLGLHRRGPGQPHPGPRRLQEGRADGRRSAARGRRQGPDLHGLRPARSDRRQSRPHPDRQGLARRQGKTQEKVYDVVWSGDRKPGADGKLPPVGNTVDVANANYTNTIGASELATVWTDPDFDPALKAFYYARVIEIPTPRWSTYDAFRFGVPIPEGAPVSTQERAYTSPIWYAPSP